MTTWSNPDRGMDLDWLAHDAAGHIAVFSTGGYGPIPPELVGRIEEMQEAADRIIHMPLRGACAESPDPIGGTDPTAFVEPCRRGFFVYDWGPVERPPYARLSVPSDPIQLGSVTDEVIRAAASHLRLNMHFAKVSAFDPSAIAKPGE